VEAFQSEFAAHQDAAHGLALTNGTHTLEAALVACGIEAGDEVVVPALTFVATATAVLAVNAVPVIVDIDPETLCIDPAAVEAAMGPRTAAVIAVHLAGTSCDLDTLTALCEDRKVHLIEDSAHAHGTRWRGRGVGSYGSFGSFSFQTSKLMTAGEGGALITNSEELLARAWSYANCGRRIDGRWYEHHTFGTNFRMTELQAAVLRAQLRRLPEQQRVREAAGEALDRALAEIGGVTPQRDDERVTSRARFSYPVRYDPAEFSGLSLEGFEAALAYEGVLIGYTLPSLTELDLFRRRDMDPRRNGDGSGTGFRVTELPVAEHTVATTLWIDQRVLLAGAEEALDVARAIERIKRQARAIALRTSKPVKLGGRLLGSAKRARFALAPAVFQPPG
jgi:dTDP-4-amino-4,6-dideoxygalactose transaminase